MEKRRKREIQVPARYRQDSPDSSGTEHTIKEEVEDPIEEQFPSTSYEATSEEIMEHTVQVKEENSEEQHFAGVLNSPEDAKYVNTTGTKRKYVSILRKPLLIPLQQVSLLSGFHQGGAPLFDTQQDVPEEAPSSALPRPKRRRVAATKKKVPAKKAKGVNKLLTTLEDYDCETIKDLSKQLTKDGLFDVTVDLMNLYLSTYEQEGKSKYISQDFIKQLILALEALRQAGLDNVLYYICKVICQEKDKIEDEVFDSSLRDIVERGKIECKGENQVVVLYDEAVRSLKEENKEGEDGHEQHEQEENKEVEDGQHEQEENKEGEDQDEQHEQEKNKEGEDEDEQTYSDTTVLNTKTDTGKKTDFFRDKTLKLYVCQICKKQIKNKQHFEAHMNKHAGVKPYKCEKCEQGFQSVEKRKCHIEQIHDKVTTCHTCNRTFRSQNYLKKHMETKHADGSNAEKGKPEMTEEAENENNEDGQLELQCSSIISDNGVRMYECGICQQKFRNRTHCLAHMNRHLGLKPFKCKQCGECFDSADKRKGHIETVHDKITTCHICNVTYTSLIALKGHMRVKHKLLDTIDEPIESNEGDLTSMDTMDLKDDQNKDIKTVIEQGNQEHEPNKTKDITQRFECEFKGCYVTFANKSEVEEHKMWHNKNIDLTCPTCGKCYRGRSQFKAHLNSHKGLKALKCKFCDEHFDSRVEKLDHADRVHFGLTTCRLCHLKCNSVSKLTSHMRIKHGMDKSTGTREPQQRSDNISDLWLKEGETQYQCKLCAEICDVDELEQHEKDRHEGDQIKCDRCRGKIKKPYVFYTKEAMMQHKVEKHGRHLCETCGKSFSEASYLKMHIREVHHHVQRKFPCEYDNCEKRFRTKGQLNNHVVLYHKGGGRALCPICAKQFINRDHFEAHVNRHNGHMPYKCDECEECFESKEKRKLHVEVVHRKLATCHICQITCYSPYHLRKHIEFLHTDKKEKGAISCPHCSYVSKGASRGNLRKHIQSVHEKKKSAKCPYCPKTFFGPGGLREHIVVHERKNRFTCELCQEGFLHRAQYKKHVFLHINGKNSVICPICAQSFDWPNNLRRHMQLVHDDISKMPKYEIPSASMLDEFRRDLNHMQSFKLRAENRKKSAALAAVSADSIFPDVVSVVAKDKKKSRSKKNTKQSTHDKEVYEEEQEAVLSLADSQALPSVTQVAESLEGKASQAVVLSLSDSQSLPSVTQVAESLEGEAGQAVELSLSDSQAPLSVSQTSERLEGEARQAVELEVDGETQVIYLDPGISPDQIQILHL